ncbi:hypothetical protein Tco_0516236 [Tanacetum coccineum]|uniref:Uncharacterized protein n=1 Tax=Tanacetum coccineum TaxID=301880 RepID=A0ABQ4ZLM6_9ASTR
MGLRIHHAGLQLTLLPLETERNDVLMPSGASASFIAEDFDTTLVVPLSNSSNIGLNSKSSSFDVVTVSTA